MINLEIEEKKGYQLDFLANLESDNGFASLCRLEFPEIKIDFSPRMRHTWKAQWGGWSSQIRVRVPAILESAPLEVKKAVLLWARHSAKRSRNHPSVKSKIRIWEKQIRDFLHTGQYEMPLDEKIRQRELNKNKKRMNRFSSKGKHHDLTDIFDWVNREYFNETLKAVITWSSRIGGLSTHREEIDANGKPYHLITISRGYDFEDVSREILGGVVYHECLHIVIPPRMVNGRRVVHGSDFRKREKQYLYYKPWIQWHQFQLPRKLRLLEMHHRDR